MAPMLLVHGSCHGAWCWRDVVPALAAEGHRAVAIDLPGRGADETPAAAATLAGYGARVAAALAEIGEPAVLVGHSAGGFAATAAAEMAPERIRHLVYLCAYAPRDGDALAAMRRRAARQPLLPALRLSGDGASFTVDPGLARGIFFRDCPAEAVDYALARLCPEPVAPQETPLRVTGRTDRLPRTYIVCTDDRTVPPEEQEAMSAALPGAAVVRLASGHSPFFSQPKRLARILSDITR